MTAYIKHCRLQVNADLQTFIEQEVAPGTGVDLAAFWRGLDALVHDLAPTNRALIAERARLQAELDNWHRQHPGPIADMSAYRTFLNDIGYLRPVPADVQVSTGHVDDEITLQGGPQLVAPLSNTRFTLNAANARWLSLYDALYGSDVISEEGGATRTADFNPVRGNKVIAFGRDFLDQVIPLERGSHHQATAYMIKRGQLMVSLHEGDIVGLKQPKCLIGYNGDPVTPTELLFKHHELHFEIRIEKGNPVCADDPAGIRDIVLESATTVIMDLEDAVAAVDPDEKVLAYRNWLSLMKGDLSFDLIQNGKNVTRRMQADRHYTTTDGNEITLHGRSLMFVRNVGLLMTSAAIIDGDGHEIPEGILDAVVTTFIAMHDLQNRHNSRAGSIYVVKPKLHGPDEMAFTNDLFSRVEQLLGLPQYTVKLGLMDEERRTSVNLKACVAAASHRMAFINTGFLDRTGDEMRTAMEAGPVIRKGDMRRSEWIVAYEINNVQVGLECGMRGRAQIGKGMWAMPDLMADMLKLKIGHLKAGANTAWVPSPTAAVIHALHYHQVDVRQVQSELEGKYVDIMNDLLTVPITSKPEWSAQEIQQELDNNAQGILGYVVRWVEQGVGCSKVPDIHNIALMEDRATLRISSLHMANWLRHGIVSDTQVMDTLKRMTVMVDRQNAGDPAYCNMADDFDNSPAFRAACDLVFKARAQPSGYTEPLLHAWRQTAKEALMSQCMPLRLVS